MLTALPPRSVRLDRIPDNLLRDPLEFLKADHLRMRRVCDRLEEFALEPEQETAHDVTEALANYLSDGFLHHIDDEELDLFPRLRVRCKPQDEIDNFLDGLCCDHNAYTSLANGIVQGLRQLPTAHNQADIENLNSLITCFSTTERRHLMLEDNIVLPLAKIRLLPEDLEQIGRSMAARRNVTYPG